MDIGYCYIMKSKKYLLAFLSIILIMGFSKVPFNAPYQENNDEHLSTKSKPFKSGEKLTYVLHYGIFNAGVAEISIKETKKGLFGNKKVLNLVGKGKTTGSTDLFYKVRDHYESYIDSETMEPLKFKRRVDEGGYKISQDYIFYPDSNQVITQDAKKFNVTEGVQDMISAFYFARTLEFSKSKIGDIYEIPAFVDNEVFTLKLQFAGRETIKLRSGKYKCLKFNPVVQEGRVFKTKDDLEVWVTDDKNKIPILVKVNIVVGSVKMELTEYEGLAHDISIVTK